MGLDPSMLQMAIITLFGLAVGGLLFAAFSPLFGSGPGDARLKSLSAGGARGAHRRNQIADAKNVRELRRKQVQQTLRQIEERQHKRNQPGNLISQSGLAVSPLKFWVGSAVTGIVSALVAFVGGLPWYLASLCGFVGLLGLPRWLLSFLRRRRQERFLDELPDAIDVMVRGLKAGLPISDALKVIAAEGGSAVGPEFVEVVEGQRVGISIDRGLERMFERMPLQEVNFLSIVVSIQTKTGGNLSETLGNLSKVLRDRRKMKGKIRSMSQEAKSSAAIIGAIPFLILGVLTLMAPDYLDPLYSTTSGNAVLMGCGLWMLTGILVMRKMINFDF